MSHVTASNIDIKIVDIAAVCLEISRLDGSYRPWDLYCIFLKRSHLISIFRTFHEMTSDDFLPLLQDWGVFVTPHGRKCTAQCTVHTYLENLRTHCVQTWYLSTLCWWCSLLSPVRNHLGPGPRGMHARKWPVTVTHSPLTTCGCARAALQFTAHLFAKAWDSNGSKCSPDWRSRLKSYWAILANETNTRTNDHIHYTRTRHISIIWRRCIVSMYFTYFWHRAAKPVQSSWLPLAIWGKYSFGGDMPWGTMNWLYKFVIALVGSSTYIHRWDCWWQAGPFSRLAPRRSNQ